MQSLSLTELIAEQLLAARNSPNGRSVQRVHGGRDHQLQQSLITLMAGHSLGEHGSPGDATLQVLCGRVRLSAGDDFWDADVGDHLAIPSKRHDLLAVDDSAVLLTVASQP